MAIHEKKLNSFVQLLEEAVEGVRPPDNGEAFFNSSFRTHDNVSYSAPEESDNKISKVVFGFEKSYGNKYTLDEIHKDIRAVFASRLQDPEHDMLGELSSIDARYESYDTHQVLVRRIGGVELSACSIKFGRVLVVPVGEHLKEIATEQIEKIFVESNLPEAEREQRLKRIIDIASDEFEGVSGQFQINNSAACVATYTATPARALERSQEEMELIIDLLRYFGVATSGRDISVDFAEAYPNKRTVAFVTSGTAVSLQSTTDTEDIALVRLRPDKLMELEEWGVFQLADYSLSGKQHGLKKAIARGVHWFSLAAKQRDKANKILLYITALESIFQRYGREKISDCCAFLLGVDAEGRGQIAEVIRSFYDLRNPIAHGGSADGVERYRSLRRLVLYSICTALDKTGEHKTAKSLCESFDVLKFSLPSDGVQIPNGPELTQ